MGFHEVNFPDRISYGSTGGPGFNTGITELRTGIEEAVARSSSARRRYNARYGIKSHADLYELIEFFTARLGSANGFRWKDWTDYATTATGTTHNSGDASISTTDETIGTGDGSTTTFQLVKTYTSGAITRTRTIEKPVAGSIAVSVDSVAKTDGVHYTVNTTNGIVTFTSAPAAAEVVKAGCKFDVPVRFGLEIDTQLPVSIEGFDAEDLSDIPVVEIKNEDELSDEQFAGGAINHGDIIATVNMAILQGFVHVWETSSGAPIAKLPATTNLPTGGPIFSIFNDGADSLVVQNQAAATIATVAANAAVMIFLGLDSGGSKVWRAL